MVRLTPSLLLLLTACGHGGLYPDPQDKDGDRWTAEVDCDDSDPAVHPMADELCNQRDDDCNGLIDDEPVDMPTWYADADADGYGAPEYAWANCEQPDGYVDNADDCDDGDATRNPDATEACDGLDNDCDGEVDETGALEPDTFYRDLDGDGYGDPEVRESGCAAPAGYVDNGDDCDDDDADIHPGVAEVCDPYDVDEDCDGLADDEDSFAEGLYTFYRDADGDSFGAAAGGTVLACEAPEGYAETDDDCDDTDRTINPVAREVCGDAVDNDCDGLVDGADDAEPVDWYTDADADGYGAPGSWVAESCDPVAGAAISADDCDDADANVHPDALETWYDGVDQDCEGDDDYDADADGERASGLGGDDCDDSDDTVYTGAIEVCGDGIDQDCDGDSEPCGVLATLAGAAAGDEAGGSVAFGGDLDGDGYDEVLIGADREDSGGGGAGAVYVLDGPLSGALTLGASGALITGEGSGDHAGNAVAAVGDMDGDGFGEVLVGAYGLSTVSAGAGGAYLVSGPLSGTISLADATARMLGEDAGDQAGYAVAGPGDVSGDGVPDLLVGSIDNDTGGGGAGAVYLLHGPVTGHSYLWSAEARLVGETAGDQAGAAVAGAGDVNGDGLDDVLVGAPYEHADGSYVGAAYVVLGGVRGTTDLGNAEGKWTGEHSGDMAGSAIAGGADVDQDGYADILVGAPEEDSGGNGAGAAYLLAGPVTGGGGLDTARAKLIGENNDDMAGNSVAFAGDLDGDGVEDLLVGARLDDGGGSDAGAVYLLLGPVSGTVDLSAADGKLEGDASGDELGAALAGGGDVDGGGLGDVLVGSPYLDPGVGASAGGAWLIGGWE